MIEQTQLANIRSFEFWNDCVVLLENLRGTFDPVKGASFQSFQIKVEC